MSLLINLLPDIRQAKIKARRQRQMVIGVSVLIWVVCGAVVLLLSLYTAGQKVMISTLNSDVAKKQDELRAISGLTEALTAQQHLASLPGLYDKRVYMTKFFAAYAEVNPNEVTLDSLAVDKQNVLVVNGVGKTYASVAKLARALEAANVTVGADASAENAPYFSNVMISNVSSSTGRGVGFTINATVGSGAMNGQN